MDINTQMTGNKIIEQKNRGYSDRFYQALTIFLDALLVISIIGNYLLKTYEEQFWAYTLFNIIWIFIIWLLFVVIHFFRKKAEHEGTIFENGLYVLDPTFQDSIKLKSKYIWVPNTQFGTIIFKSGKMGWFFVIEYKKDIVIAFDSESEPDISTDSINQHIKKIQNDNNKVKVEITIEGE